MYPFHPEFSTWHMLYKCSIVNIEHESFLVANPPDSDEIL